MIVAALALQTTQGALLLVGGGTTTKAVTEKFFELCGGKDAHIVVLPQTRQDTKRGQSSVDWLKENGATNVSIISDDQFSAERLVEVEKTLRSAKGLWVPGGDQNLFPKRFGLEWSHRVFPDLIKKGCNWFGTSAGAMVTSDPMIGGNNPDGTATITDGLGLVDALVDTHYGERKRENRLRGAFFKLKHEIAIGLDEGDWIIVRDKKIEESFGDPRIILRESL